MSTVTFDVAIVGAGIVGAACADECALRGLQVVLLDRDAVGAAPRPRAWDTSWSWMIPKRNLR